MPISSVILLLPLFALIAPFLIWPIEILLPYPYIIEELMKAVFVFFILKIPNNTSRIKMAIAIAILFSFSEDIFYFANMFMMGGINVLFGRLLFTLPMHILTILVILISALKDKRFIILGIVLAGLIHFFFNQLIPLIQLGK